MTNRLDKTENVARYVGGTKFDSSTGKVYLEAFDREKKDTDGLSFNRTGMLGSNQKDDDRKIREIMSSRITVGKNAVFAELNVADAISSLSHFGDKFYFEADPLAVDGDKLANPVHALLIGLPFKGETAGPLIAELASDLLSRKVRRIFWAHPDRGND
jgi:hypothetical protein